MKPYYLTTAIDYANGSPHLGHAYEKVLADVISRTKKAMGQESHLVTGLDEHGQKVQQGAEKEGVEPQVRCDLVAEEFLEMLQSLNISHDDYIRTTESRHKKVVSKLLLGLYERGEIYQAEYSGFYSMRAEQFLQEKDKVNGEWPEIFGEVSQITEKNYFFKLHKYQDWLVKFLEENPKFIIPSHRQSQVIEFLKEPLNDLCISRPIQRLSWGIPLPFDQEYVTYVWFDALVNYVTAAGYGEEDFSKIWPADLHIIGKDILAPPHAVYWPIMLKACNIELPKQILAHGWWMSSGAKMSKSTGESIDPLDLVTEYGSDIFRYFVMREMKVGQDAEFSLERFESRYRADLGNDLGNLVSRLLHMCGSYFEKIVPQNNSLETPELELLKKWEYTRKESLNYFEEFQFSQALEQISGFIRAINKYADERLPWKLAKSTAQEDLNNLQTCISTMVEALRLANSLLVAVMPDIHAKINDRLGLAPTKLWEKDLVWDNRLNGKQLKEKIILFPRK